MDNKVQEELDLLREIFPDEFKVNFNLNQYVVTFVVTPGIGFNNPPSKLIKFNLIMMFTLKYPTESPTISIECVHGLKEKDISNLLSYLKELISERKGDPVLFDLVDLLCPLCHAESLSFSEDLINVTRSKENTESCDSSK
ncbi:E3 ubiquitin-protein ligase [Schistosoma japonicum]|nr:E3 ubiquitin-protein ligase [Schistosoma japonicum]